MGKATKKKSSKGILAKELTFLEDVSKQSVTFQNYNTLCSHRTTFLNRLRNDRADYLLNLKNIHSKHELELLLNIQQVLFQYDMLISEMDKELNPIGYELYTTKDNDALRLFKEYVG